MREGKQDRRGKAKVIRAGAQIQSVSSREEAIYSYIYDGRLDNHALRAGGGGGGQQEGGRDERRRKACTLIIGEALRNERDARPACVTIIESLVYILLV
jgi:hypothetical protein